MPAIPAAGHQARISVFHNAVNSGQAAACNDRQLQGLLGISNTSSHCVPDPHAVGRNQVYEQLSLPVSPRDIEGQGGRIATGRIATAMKQHPWATGIVVATAVVSAVVVASQTSGSSEPQVQWPDEAPQPQPLIMPGSDASASAETIVGVCTRAINRFPRAGEARENFPSMAELHSLKRDAKSILQMAQSMVLDGAAGSRALQDAAGCSGSRLRAHKVVPLIADLQAEKSRLLEGVWGDSIDMPERVLVAQLQTSEIDLRLAVLTEISSHLYDATVILNARLLEISG